jgi:hypothetical protein
MNAAYRIESSGEAQKILISDDTAEILKAGGKTNWTAQREDEIFIKGKGNIRCHWLKTKGGSGCSSSTEYTTSVASSSQFNDQDDSSSSYSQILSAGDEYYRLKSEKTERLIAFNTENLAKLLREIVARRAGRAKKEVTPMKEQAQSIGTDGKTLPIDEVAEIIDLPEFSTRQQQKNPDSIQLPYEVMQQLKDYVRCLASMYHNNPVSQKKVKKCVCAYHDWS